MSENLDKNEEFTGKENLNDPSVEEIKEETISQEVEVEDKEEENGPSLQEQLESEKDRYIRLFAEFENYKKRTQKEKMEFFQYANQDLMTSMLGVLDDFERALKEIAKSGSEEQLKGVELIYQKLKSKLQEKGLKSIEVSAGDVFSVDLHEAITQIPAPSEELKGKIVDVIETGYTLHDRVIRFAKVVTGN